MIQGLYRDHRGSCRVVKGSCRGCKEGISGLYGDYTRIIYFPLCGKSLGQESG